MFLLAVSFLHQSNNSFPKKQVADNRKNGINPMEARKKNKLSVLLKFSELVNGLRLRMPGSWANNATGINRSVNVSNARRNGDFTFIMSLLIGFLCQKH